jgi:ATP-binding cassette, subfamily F, member 3
MIRFSQVSLARGTKPLLELADLSVNPGERVGLIGANGSGKSSLFALLRGELHTDKGEVEFPGHWRLAHVAQETLALERPAVEYAIDGDTNLRTLERDLLRAEQADNGNRIAELHAALADADVYTVRSRAETLLTGLGFKNEDLLNPVSSFSGGWRMRLNLAQALMCPSDLLLLDEPTNHLDLDAILWLEEWLKRYAGTLIVVSHDRDFLDGVVDVIAHIDSRKLRRYSGDYSSFERERAQALVLAQNQIEKQARERAHLQSFIDRFKAKATKARQAQSRMKMLAKMEDLAPLHVSAPFSFEFREPLRAPNPLLVFDGIRAGYAEEGSAQGKTVLEEINFSLQAEQRIGLLGVNGAGKSTLIKTIAGTLRPLSGNIISNKGIEIGYFAQHQVEMLRDDQSPLWHLSRISEKVREQELRDYLGSFNFPGDMATGSIEYFSGGEKARLALALIVWQRPNLLLLDEPTNHLDLETREALAVALAQFEGTLILVSHDRHLLRVTTEDLWIVADGRLRHFDGDLEDYRDWLLNRRPAAEAAEAKPRKAAQQKAKAVDRKPIEARLQRIEREMAKLGEQKAAIEARLGDQALYAESGREALKALLLDQAYVGRALAELESEWLEKQALLEAAAGGRG